MNGAGTGRALLGLDREQLKAELEGRVDREFRLDQIYHALYVRRVESFEAMTDLARSLREDLAGHYEVGLPEVRERERAEDGTRKFLFELSDGATVEAVDIPDGERRTICVSSQAGCALACTFCVTGYWGAGRNLTPGEIVGQVHRIRNSSDGSTDERGVNLVFMGMGEPLLNLGAVKQSLDLLNETVSLRRITVSTAGVVPGIEEMARWERRPNLAISLHAADDERRSRIMPINRKYPLDTLMAALRRYPLERGRRITFEYTLIEGFNDDPKEAVALARRLDGVRSKVNLIPMNPDPVLGDLRPPPPERIDAFQEAVLERGLACSVRRPRGDDVGAACGQLRAFGRAPRSKAARQRTQVGFGES